VIAGELARVELIRGVIIGSTVVSNGDSHWFLVCVFEQVVFIFTCQIVDDSQADELTSQILESFYIIPKEQKPGRYNSQQSTLSNTRFAYSGSSNDKN